MDKLTIAAYNEQAEKYDDETKDFWQRFPATFINLFAKKVAKGEVLDVGSGPGRDAEILREKKVSVTCLDASSAMLKLTRRKGFKSIKADLLKLPMASELFDGVWAYTSLLHIPKSQISQSLKEIERVLKPKGYLGLGMIEGNEELYKEATKVSLPRLFAYYSKTELEKLLSDAGFTVTYFESFKPKSRNYLHFLAQKTK